MFQLLVKLYQGVIILEQFPLAKRKGKDPSNGVKTGGVRTRLPRRLPRP